MDREQIQKELRRNRSTLSVVGLGVIAFGAWSVVKTILIFVLRVGDPLANAILADSLPPQVFRTIFYAVIVLMLASDLLLRLYVGLSARKVGFGGKKGSAYIVLACLLAVMSIYGSVYTALHIGGTEAAETPASSKEYQIDLSEAEAADNTVVSVIVEVTASVTLIELIVAAVRVRQLEQKAAEQGGAA